MNQGNNSINKAINSLEKFYWLDSLSATLSSLHRKHGHPHPPETSFGRTPRILPFLRPEKIGNLAGYERYALDAYNDAVKLAYACIDWQYSGLLTAIANESRGDENWNAYVIAARIALQEYFETVNAFEDFESYMLDPAKKALGLDL